MDHNQFKAEIEMYLKILDTLVKSEVAIEKQIELLEDLIYYLNKLRTMNKE